MTATLLYRKKGLKPKVVVQKFKRCATCVSRRAFLIRIRKPSGRAIRSATVFVNGRKVNVVRGKRLRAPVRLTNLPKGTFKVRIRVTTRSGAVVNGTRTYRTCTKKQVTKKAPRV